MQLLYNQLSARRYFHFLLVKMKATPIKKLIFENLCQAVQPVACGLNMAPNGLAYFPRAPTQLPPHTLLPPSLPPLLISSGSPSLFQFPLPDLTPGSRAAQWEGVPMLCAWWRRSLSCSQQGKKPGCPHCRCATHMTGRGGVVHSGQEGTGLWAAHTVYTAGAGGCPCNLWLRVAQKLNSPDLCQGEANLGMAF